jgi:hypothetical protein
MRGVYIFIARLVIASVAALVISLLFFNGIHPIKTPLLTAGLMFFAFVFEKSRNNK